MIQVTHLYFAFLRERIGTDQEVVEIPEGSTVRSALDWLVSERGVPLSIQKILKVAINQEYASMDLVLKQGDEIVFITPVAGG